MKKFLAILALFVTLGYGMIDTAYAQDPDTDKKEQTDDVTTDSGEESASLTAVIKDYFIQGGWGFMLMVLLCLILGLAIAIERIIALNLSSTNTKQLVDKLDGLFQAKGKDSINEAKALCQNTPGPVAAIFAQGLERASEGSEAVEKSIIGYGSVEMGRLEKGLVWISLFISLAPMLGFMGTVIGMIQAFNKIQEAGELKATAIAGEIKVALLTTVGGLIVAIILQIFYNYCVSKVDSIVNDMEDASMSIVDKMVAHNVTAKN